MAPPPEEPIFFASGAEWRRWLGRHHASAAVLWVGYYKRDTGRPSLTWAESVDQALCYGWIDGIRKRIDEERYRIRFTPRRAGSVWSAINTRRVAELKAAGLMAPAGLRAFEERDALKSELLSFERARGQRLSPALTRRLKANRKAAAFFRAQPPGYQRLASWWIMSAKREDTRLRRLSGLIAFCEQGRRIPAMGEGKADPRKP